MNEEQLKVVLKAEFGNFKTEIKGIINHLKQFGNEAKKTKQYVSDLSKTISSDTAALNAAKQKFIDIASAYGKTSDKAQQAANKIKTLSSALADNREKYKDLSNLADSFDITIPQQQEKEDTTVTPSINVDETEKSLSSLKQTMEEIRNYNFLDLAITAIDGLRNSFKKAKLEIHGAGGALDMFNNALLSFRGKKVFTEFTDGFTGSFKERFSWFKDSMINGFEGIGKSISTLGSGITAALGPIGLLAIALAEIVLLLGAITKAVKGLISNSMNVAKELKEVNTEAAKVNMNIRAYQEWGYVLKQCGIESSKLTDFVKKLSEKQKEVSNGSEEVSKAYKELGMSASEVVSMGQEELFAETIRRLQNVENATQRTSLAYRIFTDDAVYLNTVLHLNNQETQSLISAYYALGAAPTDTLINQSLRLSASTTNLSYAWQGLKNTLAQWVLPLIISVIQWVTKAIAIVNVFLKALFGVSITVSSSVGSATNNASKGMSNLGKSIGSNTKAAEKLKRTLMGFDELNVVSNPNSASGGGGGGVGGISGGGFGLGDLDASIPLLEPPDISGITAWVEKYKEEIQTIVPIALIIIGLLSIIYGFAFLSPLNIIAGAALCGLGIGIGSVEGGLFDRIYSTIEEFVPKATAAIKGWITDTWNSITKWASDTGNKFKEVADNIYKKFIEPVINYFKDLWDEIVEILTPIVEWFSELFSSVWETIKSYFEVIVGIFRGSWEAIKAIWGVVSDWFDENIIQPVSTFFKDMWEGISEKADEIWGKVKKFAKDAWEGIKEVFSPVAEWFEEKFSKAWKKVKEVFSTGGEIFEGMKEGIEKVFTKVVNKIIDGINKVIAKPFNAINSVLNKIRGVEVAGIQPFKSYIKYNALSIPQIPKLATGGIAVSSVLANVGEAGKEAILPLERNTGWMDTLAEKIASRNGSNAPTKVILKVGEREFGEVAINAINGITRQSGALQLEFA